MNRDDNLCWFHGKLPRESAEQILKEEGTENGAFLVRESNTSPGDYVLSVLINEEVCHYQIRRHGEDAFFSIDNQQPIHGLDSLIEHYQKASNGLVTQLTAIIKRDPPPHDSRSHGRTNLLHRATKEGEFTVVSELLKCGYRNIDAKNQDGQTAVHLVCFHSTENEERILKLLIDSEANVNCRDKDGNTPLHYACRSKSASFVQLLIDAKANIQARNNETGWVPLHDAAHHGNFEAVKKLLAMNAPQMARSAHGELPIDFARQAGHSQIVEYLDNYIPPAATTYTSEWDHGTLDRSESKEILHKYADNMLEAKRGDPNSVELPQSDNPDDPDKVSETSGVFLVRYSKKENSLVLTLLDNKQLKNFIIRKYTKYLYIDEGPYMPSLEHLIQHYMRFSDGLPINLRYPVPPKPKPPLPVFPIPKPKAMASSPSNSSMASYAERKSSVEHYPTNSMRHPKRNLSIPSDELMNRVGILSTSPKASGNHNDAQTSTPTSRKKSTSDLLKFASLKKSLTRNKSPKDKESKNRAAESAAAAPDDNGNDTSLVSAEDISQSLKNITFRGIADDMLYNVPKSNSIASPNSRPNTSEGSTSSPSIVINGDDAFTQSDKLLPDSTLHENDNSVEEIYFVEAPTKLPVTFNYLAFRQVPFFPDPLLTATNHNNNVDVRLERNPSIVSKASNESEFMRSLGQTDDSEGPNYYIPVSLITLKDVLGEGEFGSVYKGTMTVETSSNVPTEIPVAIKTLHDERCKENRAEFLREASVMIKLSHHCIVKLIGISKGPPLMIVQELVGLGSLLNYLQENTQTINPKFELKIWASQIACGMNYLQSQHFVHRDLAARNILLASMHQAKISDFGLSRALRPDDNYYQASQGGKWPIKWYAPESFNFGTFSHASDVWSFGVTLWEMFSYGQPPYGVMQGVEVIKMIGDGQRLARPDNCPDHVYVMMENCWHYNPKERPTFRHLTEFFAQDPDYQNIVDLIKTQNIL